MKWAWEYGLSWVFVLIFIIAVGGKLIVEGNIICEDGSWNIEAGEDKKGNLVKYFDERKLKAEAIKWVKEDINDVCCFTPLNARQMIERWMKRLNITEEDLK